MVFARDWFSSPLSVCSSPHLAKPFPVSRNSKIKILRICIWCRQTEEKVSFKKVAHTIPQSLGGKNICCNVCDSCNLVFGSHYQGSPSVETIIKETFNVSRMRFLNSNNQIGKNKKLPRFSSIYFDVNFNKRKIDLKLAFRLQAGFQEKICRQLKKGIYKIYLEEIERQKGIGLDPQFDFIREFARYNLGDYPVFYFQRSFGAIAISNDWVSNPQFHLEGDYQMKYLVQEPGFFEFELLGHVFGITTSRSWEIALDNYLKKTGDQKKKYFKSIKSITKLSDIDLLLSILDE